ncbi:protein MRG1-like isoform X2 [Juglans microcarpa x Juglans regia]|uniref:protein MRG1-like isoform X2 n=1 Tax=Juglans microcarpa x Juglans regia TaxID=2249226 RepID=UPI001B7F232D|nr:protein MRG1-like isoform X2 [Juglans microcarpa x Juglans regia]
MGSSKTGATDSSATESDITKTDPDMEIDGDDGDCPPDTDSCPFSEGEKVLAFHSVRIYEAKIEYQMEWRFFVHYPGWSKNWDEWVGVDRLMKFTEENVQKQQALNKKQSFEKNTKLARASLIKPKSSHMARAKKRKTDFVSKEDGNLLLDRLVNIQLPPPLKKQLVDDCEFITHLGKLVKLPRTPNVDDILRKYLDYRMKKDGLISDSVGEVLKGLRCYFDKVLPVMLLYKSERQQYDEANSDDVSPSTVYGAEHLLRLFVKLPELLYHANIEEETLMELQQKLIDFLKFLQKHQSAFFLSTYHVPEDIETSTNN